MKKIKKLFGLVLVLLTLFGLAGCNSSESKNNNQLPESNKLESFTVSKNGLLTWNSVTDANYYMVECYEDRCYDADKYIEKTSTSFHGINKTDYYYDFKVTLHAFKSRSEETEISNLQIIIVVQNGKFYTLDTAPERYTVTIHYVDENENELKTKVYVDICDTRELQTGIKDRVRDDIFRIDLDAIEAGYFRDLHYNYYTKYTWLYDMDGNAIVDKVLASDIDLKIYTFQVQECEVQFYADKTTRYLVDTVTVDNQTSQIEFNGKIYAVYSVTKYPIAWDDYRHDDNQGDIVLDETLYKFNSRSYNAKEGIVYYQLHAVAGVNEFDKE